MIDIGEVLPVLLHRLGWEPPTSLTDRSMSWSYVDGTGQRHIVAAWHGEEMERVENEVTGETVMVPTGRRGIMVSGRSKVCETIAETVEALIEAARKQWEPELLKMFNLRREFNMISMPVVPIDQIFVYNDYGDAIRNSGYI